MLSQLRAVHSRSFCFQQPLSLRRSTQGGSSLALATRRPSKMITSATAEPATSSSTKDLSTPTGQVQPLASSLKDGERLILNISGMRYETLVSTLSAFPETLLGD